MSVKHCIRKAMMPLAVLASLAVSTSGGEARSLDEILQSETLRVGVVPYSVDVIKDPGSGEYKGVFVDAIKYICEEINVECQFQEYTWQSFIGGLQADQVDLSIATTFATIPRATAVLFSEPIYDLGYKAVTRKGDDRFKTVQDLNNPDVRVAVPQGTGQMAWVQKVAPQAQLRAVPTEEGALLGVVTGQADVSISATAAANHALATQPGLTEALGGRIYDVNQVAWAMPRGNFGLKFFIDTALGKLKASGKLQEIAEKYDAPWRDTISR